MEVIIKPNAAEASLEAANIFAKQLRAKPTSVLGLARTALAKAGNRKCRVSQLSFTPSHSRQTPAIPDWRQERRDVTGGIAVTPPRLGGHPNST